MSDNELCVCDTDHQDVIVARQRLLFRSSSQPPHAPLSLLFPSSIASRSQDSLLPYTRYTPPAFEMAQAPGHNDYLTGYKKSNVQHHEWRDAENSAAYLLPVLQTMVKEKPLLKLLDVGAGSGTITTSLAVYMPQGTVVGVDISEEILKSAATHAREAGVGNITFRTGNIYELPFPDNSFDVVHASMILTHLDAPADALREMLRVTSPGGVVANRESDLSTWSFYPEIPGMAKMQGIFNAVHATSGANPKTGTRLVSYAMQAGAKREHITNSYGTWTYSTPEERAMWGGMMAVRMRTGALRDKALANGMATEADFEEGAQAWEEWAKAVDASFGCMHGEILVRKE